MGQFSRRPRLRILAAHSPPEHVRKTLRSDRTIWRDASVLKSLLSNAVRTPTRMLCSRELPCPQSPPWSVYRSEQCLVSVRGSSCARLLVASATIPCKAADRILLDRLGPTQANLFISNADGTGEHSLTQSRVARLRSLVVSPGRLDRLYFRARRIRRSLPHSSRWHRNRTADRRPGLRRPGRPSRPMANNLSLSPRAAADGLTCGSSTSRRIRPRR